MNKDNIKGNRKKIAIIYLLSFVLFDIMISVTENETALQPID